MTLTSDKKLTRVNIRISEQEKEIIAQAASALNMTLSRFVVERAYLGAQAVLADEVHFRLSRDQWEAFCAALDRPVRDLPSMRKLLTESGVFDD